jgi:glycosyltransferase involved in cell wall biosynthesis
MLGGSEYRCLTLSNSIAKYTCHDAYILCEDNIPKRLEDEIDKKVYLIKNVIKDKAENAKYLYDMDVVLVVNSDSYNFTKLDYWEGRTEEHKNFVDISRIKKLVFLFNFVISPSQHLPSLESKCKDIRIICTNKRFFNEFDTKDKIKVSRHYPRFILNSPIEPSTISEFKTYSNKIRIGRHSLSVEDKFNSEYSLLINTINSKYKNKIEWDFMGVPKKYAKTIENIENVKIRKEFSLSVKDYLMGIDIFLFFPAWKRTEPWARVIAEGMMSGCPIIATNKGGNIEQVISCNNGFLCDTLDDFINNLSYLIENPNEIKQMGNNSKLYAKEFCAKNIIDKFLNFTE